MLKATHVVTLLTLCFAAAPVFADATADARAVDEAFGAAVNARNASAAASFYADDAAAIYVGQGQEATGRTAIGEMLTAMLKDIKVAKLVFIDNRAFPIGDSHLMNLNHWEFTVTGTDGKTTSFKGRSSELMVKGQDGRWLFLVDHASVGLPPPPRAKKHVRHRQ